MSRSVQSCSGATLVTALVSARTFKRHPNRSVFFRGSVRSSKKLLVASKLLLLVASPTKNTKAGR